MSLSRRRQLFQSVVAASNPVEYEEGEFVDKVSLAGITDLAIENMGGGVTRCYVAVNSLSKFYVLDFNGVSFSEIYTNPLPLSAKPFRLFVDDTHIYYSSNTDNDVCKIPKSNMSSVTSVDVGVSTWEIAEIDTDYIVVANGLSKSFKVVEKSTMSVVQTVPTPNFERTRSPQVKGNHLFVIDENLSGGGQLIEVYEWNDVTKQFNTLPVESVPNRGQVQMYLKGDNLFVADGNDKAYILDVSNPLSVADVNTFTGVPTTTTGRVYISSGGNFIIPDKINPDGILAYNSAQALQYDVIDGTNLNDPFIILDSNNFLFSANSNGDLTAHYKQNP